MSARSGSATSAARRCSTARGRDCRGPAWIRAASRWASAATEGSSAVRAVSASAFTTASGSPRSDSSRASRRKALA